MRRLALLAVILAASSSSAFSSPSSGRPTVRVVDGHPLTLRGTGFAPRERVKLFVSVATAQRVRVAHAGPRGGFTVVLRRVVVGPCASGLSVRAIGSRGSRVYYQLHRPDRMCPLGGRTRSR